MNATRQHTLNCLATLFRFHGLALGADVLHRELGGTAEIAADDIVRAIETVLKEGPRTRDMGGKADTAEVGRAIAAAL